MSSRRLVLANNPLLAGPTLDDRVKVPTPFRSIDVTLIDRDPNQPRVIFDEDKINELSKSISLYGVISPLLVRPQASTSGRYTLVAGERRLRAAKIAGLAQVPAIIDAGGDDTGERTMAMQLIENLQREDLTPLERAHAIGAMRESLKLSIRELAEKLGLSKSLVQRSLEILELPDDLLNALRDGVPESKVLLLSKIEDREVRSRYLKDIDQIPRENISAMSETTKKGAALRSDLGAEDQRIVDELQRALGLRVTMTRKGRSPDGGRLTLDFYTNDDLREVFRKLIAE